MLLLAMPFSLPSGASAQEPPRAELPRTPATSDAAPEDVESIDAIIGALYEVISGAAGEPRDWERMRSLFHPGARLIPTGLAQDGSRATAVVQSVDDYIRASGPVLVRDGFYEVELQREAMAYGHIARCSAPMLRAVRQTAPCSCVASTPSSS
jgi:hypothetical protein